MLFLICPRADSRMESETSINRVRNPDCANAWARPTPMTPAPITPIVSRRGRSGVSPECLLSVIGGWADIVCLHSGQLRLIHVLDHGQQRVLNKQRNLRHCRRSQQRHKRKVDLECFTQLSCYSYGQQRIAAQPEKLVMNSNGMDSQQLLPYFRDFLLGRIAGRNILSAQM